MTSSTSARAMLNPLKSALAYVIVALSCAFFGAVYEHFSHEVYSYFMIYAFAIPLILGALPNLIVALKGLHAPDKLATNIWNAGVATLTVGCIFEGALAIYGTTSQLALAYPIAGALLLVAGASFQLAAKGKRAIGQRGGRACHTARTASQGIRCRQRQWERSASSVNRPRAS